mmetsp:Transcript_112880/g.221347  ORF Transcript_112880/g.221347 Transcript_112880/m.221347 type:complete len:274 (+) Transcript_112880:144-965(+)
MRHWGTMLRSTRTTTERGAARRRGDCPDCRGRATQHLVRILRSWQRLCTLPRYDCRAAPPHGATAQRRGFADAATRSRSPRGNPPPTAKGRPLADRGEQEFKRPSPPRACPRRRCRLRRRSRGAPSGYPPSFSPDCHAARRHRPSAPSPTSVGCAGGHPPARGRRRRRRDRSCLNASGGWTARARAAARARQASGAPRDESVPPHAPCRRASCASFSFSSSTSCRRRCRSRSGKSHRHPNGAPPGDSAPPSGVCRRRRHLARNRRAGPTCVRV